MDGESEACALLRRWIDANGPIELHAPRTGHLTPDTIVCVHKGPVGALSALARLTERAIRNRGLVVEGGGMRPEDEVGMELVEALGEQPARAGRVYRLANVEKVRDAH